MQQHGQKQQWQEVSLAQSMAQSLADFCPLPAVFGVDTLRANPNLFGNLDYSNELGTNALHSQVGGENWRDPSKLRKRGREEHLEEDEAVVNTSAKSNLLMGKRQHVLSAESSNPSNRVYPSFCCPEDPDSNLLVSMEKDLLEMDLFISAQVEKAMAEMEQRRRRLWAGVVRAVEDGVRRVVKARDEEIASVARRNSALEERINVLALEGQMWKALARTSEAAAAALRRDIELAQQAAAGAGGAPWNGDGCGGEVEDSVSYCEGRHGKDLEEGEGECGGSPRRRCRMCGRGEVSRLVLPCRHLCLCRQCDSGTESCPICGCPKRATIKVYLS